jgi:hypothetical protein
MLNNWLVPHVTETAPLGLMDPLVPAVAVMVAGAGLFTVAVALAVQPAPSVTIQV